MTGEKRTETRMRCYNTLCIPYIRITPPLTACIVYDCREGRGVIYREYTECYSTSSLFLFFFHQSSLYPIKIFLKKLYLLVCILFSPNFERAKVLFFFKIFVNCQCTNGHGVIIVGVIGSRFATLLHHSLHVGICYAECGHNAGMGYAKSMHSILVSVLFPSLHPRI